MNGISIKYVELLGLSIEQSFYENGICRKYTTNPELDIALAPTDSAASTMKKTDLVWRNTAGNGGLLILARVSKKNGLGNDVLRFAPGPEDTLTFLMMANNPDVVNFNDLPVQPAAGYLYYFSNTVNDPVAPRNNLHLSLADTGVDGGNDIIKASGPEYRFHNPSPVVPGTAKIIHIVSGDLLSPTSLITQGGQSDLSFNLSSFQAGRCRLLIGNVVTDEFFYTGSVPRGFLFGIVEVSLSAAIAANYRVLEPDNSLIPGRPLFTIRFNNRQTLWRYAIHMQVNSPLYQEMAALSVADKADFLDELNIVSNDASITFKKTNNTDTLLEFVSDNIIALREKYMSASDPAHAPLILTLQKYIDTPAKKASVKSNLPYPSPGNINASALPKIYSDIFLTI